jgi:phosphate/sulfate permease
LNAIVCGLGDTLMAAKNMQRNNFMSIQIPVSRSFALSSCIIGGVGLALACNFALGQNLVGNDLLSSVVVGSIIGGLFALALGVTDIL